MGRKLIATIGRRSSRGDAPDADSLPKSVAMFNQNFTHIISRSLVDARSRFAAGRKNVGLWRFIHDALGQFRRRVDEILAIVEHDKNFHINNRVRSFIMSVGVRRKAKAVRRLIELIS